MSCVNQPSTRFSHDDLVGVKCRCQRARFGWASHSAHWRRLVSREVVQHDVHVEVLGDVEVDQLEERQHVVGGVALAGVVQDLAGADVHRGEQVDGAVALVVMGHRPGPARLHRQATAGCDPAPGTGSSRRS